MHLLCDVLPCPIQPSHANTQQNISQSVDESQTKVVRRKTQVPGNSMNTFTDEPVCEHMPPPPPASSGALEREGPSHHKRSDRTKREKVQTKESEKNEKNSTEQTAMSFRKQKKSTRSRIETCTQCTKFKSECLIYFFLCRYTVDRERADGPDSTNRSSSHQRVPKKVMPWAEQQQQEGSQGFSSEGYSGDHAPPPSPIHSALGQVSTCTNCKCFYSHHQFASYFLYCSLCSLFNTSTL